GRGAFAPLALGGKDFTADMPGIRNRIRAPLRFLTPVYSTPAYSTTLGHRDTDRGFGPASRVAGRDGRAARLFGGGNSAATAAAENPDHVWVIGNPLNHGGHVTGSAIGKGAFGGKRHIVVDVERGILGIDGDLLQ